MTHAEVEEYLLSMPNARLDYPFGKDVAVYKAGQGEDAKMFAQISFPYTTLQHFLCPL